MKRLITAIGLLALAVYLIWWAPTPIFLAAALAMGLLCYREYSDLVAAHSILRPGIWGILLGIFILFWPQHALSADLVIACLTCLLIFTFINSLRFPSTRDVLPQAACVLLGAFYTFVPWRLAVVLREQSVHLLFFSLALNWAGDTAAYYVGRAIGKHKLAPVLSPKKSWEGAVASVAGSLILGLLYLGHFTPDIPLWEIIVMAVIGNVAGQLGDLAESAMKRGAGVKDSGNILPGHGGILDRVDSSLFAIPLVYIIYIASKSL